MQNKLPLQLWIFTVLHSLCETKPVLGFAVAESTLENTLRGVLWVHDKWSFSQRCPTRRMWRPLHRWHRSSVRGRRHWRRWLRCVSGDLRYSLWWWSQFWAFHATTQTAKGRFPHRVSSDPQRWHNDGTLTVQDERWLSLSTISYRWRDAESGEARHGLLSYALQIVVLCISKYFTDLFTTFPT